MSIHRPGPCVSRLAAMTSLVVCAVVINSTSHVGGSVIQFNTTTTSLKPLLTKNLKLRSSLTDTTPNVSGSVVGRSLASQLAKKSVSPKPPNETSTENADVVDSADQPAERSLTNTTVNVDFVTSIIISQNGLDIASISDHVGARPVVSSPGLLVTGGLSDKAGERGYLEITWEKPTAAQVGTYTCDVDTISNVGRSFDFSRDMEIREEEITLNDLVGHVARIDLEKDQMKTTISDLEKQNAALQQKVMLLENKTETNVFFSVGYSGSNLVASGQTVVYNHIFSNVGNAYNPATGIFTCPFDGYYQFTVFGVSSYDKTVQLRIMQNASKLFEIVSGYNNARGYSDASNSATVRVSKGDQVKVVADDSSDLQSTNEYFNTFSGQLISLV